MPPLVLANRAYCDERFDQIPFNDLAGMVKIVDYLAHLGHNRIAHLAGPVLRTVQRAGLRVPQEISVVDIDDQPFCTFLNHPALTTMQLPVIEAGKRAVEMLLARLVGERATTTQETLPCPLIVRESSGPPPV